MRTRSRLRVATGLLALVAAAGIAALAYQALAERRAERAVSAFLERHWAQPIAPQGAPPPEYSELEAALAPRACGACHAKQFADWQTSLHARAVGPGLRWQLRTFDAAEANDCLRCHAPLAEQKALAAREHGWPNAPSSDPPAYVDPQLHLQGIVCAACHVRAHRRYGPLTGRSTAPAEVRLPHDGATAAAAFSDSRFCSTCHQFPADGRSVNGKLLENTYEEWRASAAAREGRSCQSCHMPERRHLWRGIHDPAMVAGALARELTVTRLDGHRVRIAATLGNRGAGHRLPTYVVPKIRVEIHLDGERRGSHLLVGHHVIGRTLDLALERELSDTRLAPGERVPLAFDIPVPPGRWQVTLRAIVAPAEHYERLFVDRAARSEELDAATRALLDQAAAAAVATRYRLDDLVVPVPEANGASAQAIAN